MDWANLEVEAPAANNDPAFINEVVRPINALDADNEVIGYQFVSLGKMTDFIKNGDDPTTAWEKAKGQYGRVDDAVKIIDPRKE